MHNRTDGLIPGVTTLQLVSQYGDTLIAQQRERQRERRRAYYQRNRERIAAQARARRAANPSRARERAAELREKNRLQIGDSYRDWVHGADFKSWRARMWQAQEGLCYLCQRELGPQRVAVIEHDHRCHPRGKSCATCRRGLACGPCNSLIGFADDDPDRLELIARNLRAARDAVTERLATRNA